MSIEYCCFGKGPPLLLIHGIGGYWRAFLPVFPALAGEREVIAPDLPGFGRSTPLPPGVEPTPAALAGAVAAFLDRLGLGRVDVAGHSLGGWVALELAAMGRCRSVTALAPGGFWAGFERLSAHAFLRIVHPLARAAPGYLIEWLAASAVGRKLLFSRACARPGRVGAAEAVESVRALAHGPGFLPTLAATMGRFFTSGAAVSCPVTIAWGDRDRLLFPRQALRAVSAIPGARLIRLEGCGHNPQWDSPEQVARAILEGSREAVVAQRGAA